MDGFRQRTLGVTLYNYTHQDPLARCDTNVSLFSGSPLSMDSQRLLKSPRKPCRKVPKNPYKVSKAVIFNKFII